MSSPLGFLFEGNPVARAVFVLSLVAVCGLAMGKIRIRGIGLGVAGVLFSGLIFGHFGLSIDHAMLDFARDFGLILFVYAIGVQVGPGFFGSLRRQGLPLNLLAVGVVVMGALVTLALSVWGNIPMAVAVGLFSGGTTNTPSLAAAQGALRELPNLPVGAASLPGLGYAVSYPFGVIGIILTMLGTRRVFGVNVEAEVAQVARENDNGAPIEAVNLAVTNPNLKGVPIRHLPRIKDSGVVVSRVKHGERVKAARPETRIEPGDVILAVGEKPSLDEFRLIVGETSDQDLRQSGGHLETRRLTVTRSEVLGKTVHELNWAARYGVVVTRIVRAGIELSPRSRLSLQFGDMLQVVGREEGIGHVIEEVGDAPRELERPSITALFIGVAIGIALGILPIQLPGMPVPIHLGLAGGPLLAAIVLSRIGHIGPLVWHLSTGANEALRELGIVLFLACVGLKAGTSFAPTLFQGDGVRWMLLASLITLLPLLIAVLIGRLSMKLPYPSLCGVLAGSMTDPPALAFAGGMTKSDAPAISYATVYPLVMLMRIIAAQLLVVFFAR